MPKPLRQFSSKDQELDRAYQNMAQFTNQLVTNPLLDGLLLSKVSLASGDTTVSHNLGRSYRGWIIVDKSAAGDVYATASKQITKSKTIVLTASTAMIVSLFVF